MPTSAKVYGQLSPTRSDARAYAERRTETYAAEAYAERRTEPMWLLIAAAAVMFLR